MGKFRKLALLEANYFKRQPKSQNPGTQAMNTYESKMKDALESDNTSDVKVQDYNQNLSRLMKYKAQSHPHPKVQEKVKNISEPLVKTKDDIIEEQLTSVLPKTFKQKGKILFEHLKKFPNVDWTDKGELVYHGTTIKGSNMTDLISDVLRKRPTKSSPEGWRIFSSVLKHANVPKELIGNTDRYNPPMKKSIPFDDTDTEDDDDDAIYRTPVKKPTTASNIFKWSSLKK